jgi:hypothetical protein
MESEPAMLFVLVPQPESTSVTELKHGTGIIEAQIPGA